jgi:acetyl-CoA acetyltransferase
MYEYGTKPEQLASIAVQTREHASRNPRAMYRDPITVDDVLESKLVADPLHKLDCCVISDGGCCIVLTTEERARDLPHRPVYVRGAAGASTHHSINSMPDMTRTAAAISGPRAFAGAGITPADVDVFTMYDSFTYTVLVVLEDLGFAPKGEGGAFVTDNGGNLRLGGALPTNTDGGGLSCTHPGMRGLFLLCEATRQLRGEAGDSQVAGAEIAVAHGSGGWLSTHGTVVLGTERA